MAVRLAQTQPHDKTMKNDDITEYTPTWLGGIDPRNAAEWIAVARNEETGTWYRDDQAGDYLAHALATESSLETLLWTCNKAGLLPQLNWRVYIYKRAQEHGWEPLSDPMRANCELYGRLVSDVERDDETSEPWGIWTDIDVDDRSNAGIMLHDWERLARLGLAYCVRARRPWESRCLYTERDANCNDYVQVHVTRPGDMHDEHGAYAGQAPVVDACRLRAMMHKTAGIACAASEALTSDAGTVYELETRGENTLSKLLESWRIPADVRLMDNDTDGVNIFRATVIERRQA